MSAVAVAKVVPEHLVCVCLAPKVKTNNKVERRCRAGKLNPAWRQTRPSVTRVNFWFDLWSQPVWSLLGSNLTKSFKNVYGISPKTVLQHQCPYTHVHSQEAKALNTRPFLAGTLFFIYLFFVLIEYWEVVLTSSKSKRVKPSCLMEHATTIT